jgi:putative holliday junction resolvase
MRTLAIDLGTRRTGLALGDAGGKLATPHDVLHGPAAAAIEPILQLIQTEAIERIVVGLPLNMDGTHGPAAEKAAEFGRILASRSGKKVVLVDERLSSFQAEEDLANRRRGGEKITRKSKKNRLDALAAAQFLQEFLDGKLAGIDLEKKEI